MRRIASVVAAALLVVAGLGATAFLFGGPSTQEPVSLSDSSEAAEAAADAPPEAAPGPVSDALPEPMADATTGSAPASSAVPADPGAPWFGIPGCTCHSDDPQVVEEHRSYRLQDCASCH